MASPSDRKYTKEHEWVKLDGDTGTVGITDYAQDQLGDIVFVDMPAPGSTVTALAKFGEIESVKAVSELYAPVSGEIVEVNGNLELHPEKVNQDPHDGGWMIKIRLADPAEVGNLMTAAAYAAVATE